MLCCWIGLSHLFFVMNSAMELNISPMYFFQRVYVHLPGKSLTDHFNIGNYDFNNSFLKNIFKINETQKVTINAIL